ncbi:calcineurin-like phosphoesterase C-terminal domain-containing protein [Algoriphagus litoralis]|uniref:calcineurin-like phosphoesterase C-terminal domain-containing protein n=1 Tax=Algoriphagus litoralis TaxID=2202829 RepID=UPI000DB90E4D|nr:calcineurin-like phosphoesterase family protein [Algoriphagus litoralis]
MRIKLLIYSISLGFVCISTQAQDLAKGYVFEDANQNGKKERREAGLAGVGVSKGQQVVATDEKGYFEIELDPGQLLFVVKPSGYRAPVDSLNRPQYFYIHKPQGSPDLKYAGSLPTGPLPKQINFGLIPNPESDNFTALVFGDPQPYNLEEIDFFDRGIVKEVEGIKNVAFGLSLGDLVGDDLSLFTPYAKAVAKVGLPWYNVMGNHDENYDVDRDELSDETFEAHFGPNTYSFNVGKVHFIVVDNILWPDPRDSKGYWGGMRSDQLDFVENDLKLVPKDHLIVLSMHIPISEEGDSYRDEDRQRLFDLLADFPYNFSMSAHTHLQKQDYFDAKQGWKQEKPHHHYNVGTTSGDWYKGVLDANGIPVSTMRDGTPKGYALVDFEGNQYRIRYQVAGKPADYQMDIFAPKVLKKDLRTTSGIFVNFFMGSDGDQVRYRVDGGEWKMMNQIKEVDPSYLVDLLEWDTTEVLLPGKRPSNAQPSRHLWKAPIPVNLPAGVHVISIEATDRYGITHKGSRKYTLID